MVIDMQDSPLIDLRMGKFTADWAKARGLETIYQQQMGSTNDLAKEQAFNEANFDQNIILYVTEHQSAGRGRNKNTWENAAPGTCLLSSWSFFMEDAPVPVTSPRTGLALFKAAMATWPFLPWSLKAPNDLYLGENKVAGLLLETITQGNDVRFIIGLGMNITTHAEKIETATSLVENLPQGVPMLGEDYIGFLDRLLFEFSLVIEKQGDALNETEGASLVHAMNLRLGETETFTAVAADGTIKSDLRTIPWSSL